MGCALAWVQPAGPLASICCSPSGRGLAEVELEAENDDNMKQKLGTLLQDAGLITEDQLQKALAHQKIERRRLGDILVAMGAITDEDLAETLASQLGLPYIDLDTVVIEPEALERLPEKFARKHNCIPLAVDREVITVAMADPLDVKAIEDVGFSSGRQVAPCVSTRDQVQSALDSAYNLDASLSSIADTLAMSASVSGGAEDSQVEDLDGVLRRQGASPVVRIVDEVIRGAIVDHASDIHIEPQEKDLIVRYRIDGMLQEHVQLPKLVHGSLVSRIKIMGRMDIAEKRVPQDGRVEIRTQRRNIDLRISSLPTQHGEKIVIRVLDQSAGSKTLEDLGVSDHVIKKLSDFISRPAGMVLVTGPTGSGKSTTLYAMLRGAARESVNVVTVEDPIEYKLAGVNQVQVHRKAGLTFAFTLRAVLRQDPDIIMVGEIRDEETAEIGLQASQTGHLVFGTLHTNDAPSAITRLIDLGMEPYLVSSALEAVVAQRLLRLNCDNCTETYTPSPAVLERLGLAGERMEYHRGSGCERCNGSGYRGRTGIFEIMAVSSRVRELIATGATEDRIRQTALVEGMHTLGREALELVRRGMTTPEEVVRVAAVRDQLATLCPSCHQPLSAQYMACPYCGFRVAHTCPSCKSQISQEWVFCPFCNAKLPGEEDSSEPDCEHGESDEEEQVSAHDMLRTPAG